MEKRIKEKQAPRSSNDILIDIWRREQYSSLSVLMQKVKGEKDLFEDDEYFLWNILHDFPGKHSRIWEEKAVLQYHIVILRSQSQKNHSIIKLLWELSKTLRYNIIL